MVFTCGAHRPGSALRDLRCDVVRPCGPAPKWRCRTSSWTSAARVIMDALEQPIRGSLAARAATFGLRQAAGTAALLTNHTILYRREEAMLRPRGPYSDSL